MYDPRSWARVRGGTVEVDGAVDEVDGEGAAPAQERGVERVGGDGGDAAGSRGTGRRERAPGSTGPRLGRYPTRARFAARGREPSARAPAPPGARSRLRWLVAAAMGAAVALQLALVWLVPLPARMACHRRRSRRMRTARRPTSSFRPTTRCACARISTRIDAGYVQALLRFEDKRFLLHPGVDPLALLRAVVVQRHERAQGVGWVDVDDAARAGARAAAAHAGEQGGRGVARGAARAAAEQARGARRLPRRSRRTAATWRASRRRAGPYFGHGARDLVPEEIATLLAVPQQPGARAPSARNDDAADAARAEVAARLVAAGALPARRLGATDVARRADAAAAVAAPCAARGVLAAGPPPRSRAHRHDARPRRAAVGRAGDGARPRGELALLGASTTARW